MLLLIVSADVADELRATTAGGTQALDPRPIAQGSYAGQAALVADRVLGDDAFAGVAALLAQGTVVDLDPAAVWPTDPFNKG